MGYDSLPTLALYIFPSSPPPIRILLLISSYMQMSSAAGKSPAPGQAVYSATKYALNGYFHTLRSEVYQ